MRGSLFQLVIIIVIFIILIIYGIALFYIYNNLKVVKKDVVKFSSEHDLESELNDMFTGDINTNKVQAFSNKLFNFARKNYNLNANSYSEIIEELKHNKSIDSKVRDHMVEFFEDVIALLYKKKETISESDKDSLKKKMRIIVRIIEKK